MPATRRSSSAGGGCCTTWLGRRRAGTDRTGMVARRHRPAADPRLLPRRGQRKATASGCSARIAAKPRPTPRWFLHGLFADTLGNINFRPGATDCPGRGRWHEPARDGSAPGRSPPHGRSPSRAKAPPSGSDPSSCALSPPRRPDRHRTAYAPDGSPGQPSCAASFPSAARPPRSSRASVATIARRIIARIGRVGFIGRGMEGRHPGAPRAAARQIPRRSRRAPAWKPRLPGQFSTEGVNRHRQRPTVIPPSEHQRAGKTPISVRRHRAGARPSDPSAKPGRRGKAERPAPEGLTSRLDPAIHQIEQTVPARSGALKRPA